MTSGVPQGSVLGPILFLIYINALPENTVSQVRLFADDTALYLTMEGADDSSVLQQELDRLSSWEIAWDMEFNPSKCQVVQVTGSRNPISASLYRLHGEILKTVSCAKYLGVDTTSNLSWGSHLDRITNSANKTLGFIKRNVRTKMSGVREAAFNTLVWLQLEYAAAIWDPHTKVTEQIEKVQRRAARWTTCNFDRMASVSAMLETLGWRTLEQRRVDSRLCLFYKTVNNMVAVPFPNYIKPNPRTSRRGHSMTFQQIHTGKDFIFLFSTGSRSVECPPRKRCQLAKPRHIHG